MSEPSPGGSLGARTAKGAGWLIAWRLISRLLGVVNTVVLVRLLLPSDFGLVALATSLAVAVDGLSYIGVQDALVRERVLDRSLYDTGFTMNLLRGILTALIIVACAWPAARFFGDARLTTIFLVLALGVLAVALANIGVVDFQRDLAFNKQIQIQLVPRVAGVIASIACAVVWRSYWALVAAILVQRAAYLLFTYVIHPYRPGITLRAWRRLVGFSFWSWANSMTALVQGRSDAIIIGGYLNPTAVGLYSVGAEVGGLASSELLAPITGALFAGFSSARRTGEGVGRAYLRAIAVVALLVLPTSAGVAVIARPMMLLVFGERWDAAVPLVQLFACIGVFRVGGAISGALLMAEGVPHIGFRIEAVVTVVRLVALLVAVPAFGLIGAAAAVAVTALVDEVIYLVVTFRRVGLLP
ncbi:MAG TPA: lipopolysaccharide biosynthesis protein, partial [Acetobacteraceae bacterium]|nr:lipopolysaccharide biosynthesis protein [Acetobacteraceae bacterium]